ncbi:WD domain, G-beta repeat [Carpediemonas membranifera]|uniref:WD domain, G-beta repeat n=1 Tax=Carpediemonas membranifera TaxID=201153 RepID=A0A8J6E4B3_9EUKA|nr:WD domain, G-beta repeat [Carpediemonas membranifera]|eukprot:KAG9394237.1 WD domain, G-beta repeat [Carpediemonas membranifera]
MECISELPPAPSTIRGTPSRISINTKTGRYAYVSGKNVYLRSLTDDNKVEMYSRHRGKTTAVRFAPSGMWIATGDDTGVIHVWDTTNPPDDRVIKCERSCFAGAVDDIAWSGDNKRLVVVGDGRQQMGEAFTPEGASLGVLNGHGAEITACDFRPTRPFFIATGSKDQSCAFFKGPPFKFVSSSALTNTVNAVRFSPNGTHVAIVSADKTVLVFSYDAEAKAFAESARLENAHTKGIYGVAWAPQSDMFATCSADGTVVIRGLDCQTITTLQDPLHGTINDQQLGVDWDGEHLISVSLDGTIRFWNIDGGVDKRIEGHQKAVNDIALVGDKLYSVDANGCAHVHTLADGLVVDTALVSGSMPKNAFVSCKNCTIDGEEGVMAANMDGSLYSIVNGAIVAKLPAEGTPIALDTQGAAYAVVSHTGLEIHGEGETRTVARDDLISVAMCEKYVAAGTTKGHVVVYSHDGEQIAQLEEHPRDVTALAFNADGTLLASGDAIKRICLWTTEDWSLTVANDWVFHTARIRQLHWGPSGKLASVSNDRSVRVWDPESRKALADCAEVHLEGAFCVRWVGEKLVTGGADASVKLISV